MSPVKDKGGGGPIRGPPAWPHRPTPPIPEPRSSVSRITGRPPMRTMEHQLPAEVNLHLGRRVPWTREGKKEGTGSARPHRTIGLGGRRHQTGGGRAEAGADPSPTPLLDVGVPNGVRVFYFDFDDADSGEGASVTFSFSVPVYNVRFRVYDIDRRSHRRPELHRPSHGHCCWGSHRLRSSFRRQSLGERNHFEPVHRHHQQQHRPQRLLRRLHAQRQGRQLHTLVHEQRPER